MHVAVTGATGLVGANLVTQLREHGHSVTATKRRSSKTDLLDGLGVAWVEAPLSDPEGLSRAFDGADVVFHCAAAVSIRRKVLPWITAANVDGTHHIIGAMKQAGAGRLVHCSSTVCVGVSDDDTPCTEETVWNFPDKGLDDAYNTTKYASEEVVRAAAADGFDAVIVNPGFMLGPLDQRPSSGRMLLEVVNRRIPSVPPGRNSFVDVRDVVAGMLAAAEKGRRGERYILAGHNLEYGDFWGRVGAIAGVKPPSGSVPLFLALLPGLLGDLTEHFHDRDPFLNSPAVRFGYERGFIASSAKAQRELGYTIRPVEDGVTAALEWFRDHGMWTPPPGSPLVG